MNKPVILISFDVEEFDIPLEYGCNIAPEEQMEIGNRGLNAVLPLLDKHSVPCTMFTTANFANCFPQQVQRMAQLHEIASHTYYHSKFETADLLASRKRLEEISGQMVTGLRMPRMKEVPMVDVKNAGYLYDSSVNPTWLPGRYNKLHISRTVFKEDGMLRLPASVSPMRIPLFWLGFKNFPYSFFLHLCKRTLKKDGYLCLYFHPWEFTNIEGYNLPGFVKRHNGVALLTRLEQLIVDLKKVGSFSTVRDFLGTQHNAPWATTSK